MESLRRGDLVIAAAPGDFGKPRPALVVQANTFDHLPTVTLVLLTSRRFGDKPLLRVAINPSSTNGLRTRSYIMIDRTITLPRAKVGKRVGSIDRETMERVDQTLATFLGLRKHTDW